MSGFIAFGVHYEMKPPKSQRRETEATKENKYLDFVEPVAYESSDETQCTPGG